MENVIKCIRSSKEGRIQMNCRKILPKEYVKELNEHPCVLSATECAISFTPEFKKHAYEEYYRGKSMREIFEEAGFDVSKLGKKRLENFRSKLISKVDSGGGFEDKRINSSRKEAQSTEAQMAKRIRELEHRNAYLEQENEFLKKIRELEEAYDGKAGKQK